MMRASSMSKMPVAILFERLRTVNRRPSSECSTRINHGEGV